MCIKSVGHEFKFTIRRYEGDGTVILKSGQADTLVEFHIFQFHRFTLATFKKYINSDENWM